jgi:thiosulfate/3-mercaptopyruvate sulfurtransferase
LTHQTVIDATTLREWVEGKAPPGAGLAVVDCRFDLSEPRAGRRIYLQGHIPDARYADLNEDLSGPITPDSGRHPLPRPESFAATLARLGIANGIQVVAYDAANGAFAARLWWMLRAWGHPDVAVLDGGYPAWIAAGGAVASGAVASAESPAPSAAEPGAAVSGTHAGVATIEAWPVVTTAQVAALCSDPRRLLVDARAAERYLGVLEPVDTVAGHIPGAENHPFASNLAADGRFLSALQLRQRWQSRLRARQPSAVVAMCGSGVTACHNLLALEIAGLPGAKLYAGSWSEWIRDPNRPIARDETI